MRRAASACCCLGGTGFIGWFLRRAIIVHVARRRRGSRYTGSRMFSPQEPGVLLIHITGQDRIGVTHALTEILARSEVRILDIGQAVIHDALALGLLVEWTPEMKASPLLSDLLLKAHGLGVQIRSRRSPARII